MGDCRLQPVCEMLNQTLDMCKNTFPCKQEKTLLALLILMVIVAQIMNTHTAFKLYSDVDSSFLVHSIIQQV